MFAFTGNFIFYLSVETVAQGGLAEWAVIALFVLKQPQPRAT